eukprot:3080002-Prymnesium_polylepis.1
MPPPSSASPPSCPSPCSSPLSAPPPRSCRPAVAVPETVERRTADASCRLDAAAQPPLRTA